MIRWTKEGKVDRSWFLQSNPQPYIQASNELADALDAAVAALRLMRRTTITICRAEKRTAVSTSPECVPGSSGQRPTLNG